MSDEINDKASRFTPPFKVTRQNVDQYRKNYFSTFAKIRKLSEQELHNEWHIKWENSPKIIKNRKKKFLYFIREEFKGLVKIGITSNVRTRMGTLQTSCPQNLELIGYLETEYAESLEKFIHDRFSDRNYLREWFTFSDDEIEMILNFCGVNIALPKETFFSQLKKNLTELDVKS